jgi:hypothetical protein
MTVYSMLTIRGHGLGRGSGVHPLTNLSQLYKSAEKNTVG